MLTGLLTIMLLYLIYQSAPLAWTYRVMAYIMPHSCRSSDQTQRPWRIILSRSWTFLWCKSFFNLRKYMKYWQWAFHFHELYMKTKKLGISHTCNGSEIWKWHFCRILFFYSKSQLLSSHNFNYYYFWLLLNLMFYISLDCHIFLLCYLQS